MGKADNLKRAKKLKEAKREREMGVSKPSAIDPASSALKKRLEASGNKVVPYNGEVKYSDVLDDFATPLLEDDDSTDQLKVKLTFCVFAWNIGLLKQKGDDKAYQDGIDAMPSFILKSPESKDFFYKMVQRKLDFFGDYKRMIIDFEVRPASENENYITVATVPIL